jgi:hypothetical protein
MRGKKCVRRMITVLLLIAMTGQLVSCGTIIYPDRRGQKGGQIDPQVVLLDGLGCLLLIIPGVAAFIVDFSTGAIYLPPGHKISSDSTLEDGIVVVRVDQSSLNRKGIEQVVSERMQRSVKLDAPEIQVCRLTSSDDVNSAQAKIRDFENVK